MAPSRRREDDWSNGYQDSTNSLVTEVFRVKISTANGLESLGREIQNFQFKTPTNGRLKKNGQ
jgi:hypothetical protein